MSGGRNAPGHLCPTSHSASGLDRTARVRQAVVSRRAFLQTAGIAGLWAGLGRLAGAQVPTSPHAANFVFTRLQYELGDWNSDMLTEGLQNGSEVNLLAKMNELSNLLAFPDEYVVHAANDQVFDHPFLYMTGHGDIDFTAKGRENIRLLLEQGGFLLADNCSGAPKVGFDRALRAQVRLMFPEGEIRSLPMDHPVFSSFYQVDQVLGGDKLMDPFLEGMDLNGRTAIIYTRNDLGCAWEGHPCHPGGEVQRVNAFQLGINIVYYALSGL